MYRAFLARDAGGEADARTREETAVVVGPTVGAADRPELFRAHALLGTTSFKGLSLPRTAHKARVIERFSACATYRLYCQGAPVPTTRLGSVGACPFKYYPYAGAVRLAAVPVRVLVPATDRFENL